MCNTHKVKRKHVGTVCEYVETMFFHLVCTSLYMYQSIRILIFTVRSLNIAMIIFYDVGLKCVHKNNNIIL